MKYLTSAALVAAALALSACNNPTPAPTVAVVGPPGPAGATGEPGTTGRTGAPGGSTVIITPPPTQRR